MNREEILKEATQCVAKDREEQYGTPQENFTVVAAMWSTYLNARWAPQGEEIIALGPEDVALLLALLKVGRITTAFEPTPDSFVDLAGYASLAGELFTEENIENAVQS